MRNSLLLTAAAAVLLVSCSSKPTPPPAESQQHEAPPPVAEAPKPVQAPDTYKAKFETTKGTFVVQVTRAWAPLGADRFYELVNSGFFNDERFFRVLPNFVVQFGINGDPKTEQLWTNRRIADDPVKESNKEGTIVFATAGPETRTTQVFINLKDNSSALDGQGFAPFGKVIQGKDVVHSFYSGYGEGAPGGNGPAQDQIETQGNAYLQSKFPRLDYIKTATVVP
jgi:peptidyl-prolyl cis-trans isomerase A (cyclophilin A)